MAETRKKLSIFRDPQREPELITAEINKLEAIIQVSRGKPGLAQRVAEAESRLLLCREELGNGY